MELRASNSYDFVRFCAASAVLFSHHFPLSRLPEPPVPGYGEDFGKLAVLALLLAFSVLHSRSSPKWPMHPSGRTPPQYCMGCHACHR
jgi:hypothetical protein